MSDQSHFSSQQGFVAFFDLLGFQFLTHDAPAHELTSLELSWFDGAPSDGEERRYALTLVLMITLRRALKSIREIDGRLVNVAQLSDGAFLWSSSAECFFECLTELASNLDAEGIMWRAGAAKGSIWYPSVHDQDLGKFIAGTAVTRSVSLESRICADRSLKEDLLMCGLADQQAADLMFTETDFPEALEFRWYLAPWRGGSPFGDDLFDRRSHQPLEDVAAERAIRRIARLPTRTEYAWNSLNADGLQHRVATVVSTANAITNAKGLSLRISDPTVARRVILLSSKLPNACNQLENELALEMQRLELGKSLVIDEGLKWYGSYLGMI